MVPVACRRGARHCLSIQCFSPAWITGTSSLPPAGAQVSCPGLQPLPQVKASKSDVLPVGKRAPPLCSRMADMILLPGPTDLSLFCLPAVVPPRNKGSQTQCWVCPSDPPWRLFLSSTVWPFLLAYQGELPRLDGGRVLGTLSKDISPELPQLYPLHSLHNQCPLGLSEAPPSYPHICSLLVFIRSSVPVLCRLQLPPRPSLQFCSQPLVV